MPLRGLTPAEAVSRAGGRGRAGPPTPQEGPETQLRARRGTQVQMLTHACPHSSPSLTALPARSMWVCSGGFIV